MLLNFKALTLHHLALVFVVCGAAGEIPGHLQYLGSHRPAEGTIEVTDVWPDPESFYQNYIKPGKPLLFKGKAKENPAYNLWSDDYLEKQYGDIKIDVEQGKKENRSDDLQTMPLSSFLKIYQKDDIYMVESLHKAMSGDYHLPKSILCGGFTKFLLDAVIWFSSGGTKSVLHFDNIDNINCLMDGSKELIFIDKKFRNLVEKDGFNEEASYSTVDVEKVDMKKFPGFRDIPWWGASMDKGDCLFIPSRWYHHVSSAGPRNLAINIWFSHLPKFNQTDCKEQGELPESLPLSKFQVHALGSNEHHRITLMEMLYSFEDQEAISIEEFLTTMKKLYQDSISQQDFVEMFGILDLDHDMVLQWDELLTFNIDKFMEEFSFIFDAEEEDENQENDIKESTKHEEL